MPETLEKKLRTGNQSRINNRNINLKKTITAFKNYIYYYFFFFSFFFFVSALSSVVVQVANSVVKSRSNSVPWLENRVVDRLESLLSWRSSLRSTKFMLAALIPHRN